jgi:formylglycine-generating enzyme required for sulfatase activity
MISKAMKMMVVCVAWAGLPTGLSANSAPVVSNVTASQRADNSKVVDIRYTLTDADGDSCTVWVSVSDNGGTTWQVPAKTFTGAIGNNQAPASNKLITWDAGKDFPGKTGSFRVRVWADDGNGPAAKVLVPAGSFPYQNTANPSAWIFIDTFLIDKYEVTVQFYCQFLNAGGNDDHWDSQQEITRQGSTGNYYYTPKTDRDNYPIRYVNCTDAEHFAQWRSQLEGVTWRLPTEQEWEKAAAWDPVANHYYTYGFHQDTIACSWCVYNNCYVGQGGLMPVGYCNGTGGRNDAKSYYGCYDMSGNLTEWTSSMYDGTNRVIRGGHYGNSASDAACANRNNYTACIRYFGLGFRLVQNPN